MIIFFIPAIIGVIPSDGSNSSFCDEYVFGELDFFEIFSPLLLDTAPERQSGRKAQISNITAAKVIY